MYAAHIIGLKSRNLSMIGRGPADAEKVKLALKSPDEYEVHVCEARATMEQAIVNQLVMRVQAFQAFGSQPNGGWYRAHFREMCRATAESHTLDYHPPTSAEVIKATMEAYGLTQNELAEMIQCHKTRVGRVLKGQGEISFGEYQTIRWWGAQLGLIEVFDALLLHYQIRAEAAPGPAR